MTETRAGEHSAAALAGAVLDEEARRRADQELRDSETILPDDLLPGVGGDPLSLRDALRTGGRSMVVLLFLLNVIDELPRTVRVLAPDIQATLGISDTVLLGVLGFGGVALVLGSVPMAALADRIKRVTIIPIASFVWAASTFLSGLVANAFQLFLTNTVTGFGQAYRIPVSNSLLTDTYPIKARARIFALEGLGRPVGQLIGPILVGTIATVAGGTEGWRWAFFIVAIPPVVVGLASFRLKEPRRGRFEREEVLGSDGEEVVELPVTMSTAFARLRKIKTFYFLATGVGVLGFALIAIPVQFNLLLEDKYNLDAFDRGVIESTMWIVSLAALPVAGRLFDRRFRQDPPFMMRTAGMLIVATGVLYLIALPMKPLALLVAMLALAQAAISASFVAAPAIIAAVSPYRIRAQAFALLPVFIFLMGGFFGGLIVGQLSDAYNERTAMLIAAPPAALIGGFLIMYGSRFIRRDISLAVEELLEEQTERLAAEADPESIPALQVRNLDYSYGPVQVLFDIEFEVAKGEVLALLGTNGAGKSTLLRAISGLGIPDRGVVRLNGHTITYAEAESRFRAGIVQLRGGAGTFPELTIADNLRSALLGSTVPAAEVESRMERALNAFPALQRRTDELARNLSGGQQQMLALAMVLMHDPEVLLIDELSLGLAPVIVQDLLAVVERLRDQGQTMIIVEQSLNVALAFADRAIFMEKGRIRFEGPAQELAERDDLARAVFLGGEGG